MMKLPSRTMLFFGQRYDRKVILGIITAFSGVVICVYFSPAFSLGGKGAGYLVLVGAILSGALYAHGFRSRHIEASEFWMETHR